MKLNNFIFVALLSEMLLVGFSCQNSTKRVYNCENQEDGLAFPDPFQCNRYYICIKEKAYHKICPPGRFFDDKVFDCLLEPLANCAQHTKFGAIRNASEILSHGTESLSKITVTLEETNNFDHFTPSEPSFAKTNVLANVTASSQTVNIFDFVQQTKATNSLALITPYTLTNTQNTTLFPLNITVSETPSPTTIISNSTLIFITIDETAEGTATTHTTSSPNTIPSEMTTVPTLSTDSKPDSLSVMVAFEVPTPTVPPIILSTNANAALPLPIGKSSVYAASNYPAFSLEEQLLTE